MHRNRKFPLRFRGSNGITKRIRGMAFEQLESRMTMATDFAFVHQLGSAAGNGVITAIASDALGNVFVSGTVNGSVDVDLGPGVATIAGAYRGFFAKYDQAGALLWSKSIGGVVPGSTGDIELDPFGNVYFAGSLWETGYTGDIDPGPGVVPADTTYARCYLLKLDQDGNTLWAGSVAGSVTGNTIDVDVMGNLYVGGAFFSELNDFDPKSGFATLNPLGGGDAYIAKVSPSGDLIWAHGFGSSVTNFSGDYVEDVAVDGLGNTFVVGQFVGTADFDPGLGVAELTSTLGSDNFIAKYGPNGEFIWVRSFQQPTPGAGFASPTSLNVDSTGNILIGGDFQETVDFDPGPLNFSLTAPNGYLSQFLCKLTTNGDFLWATGMSTTQSFVPDQIVLGKNDEIVSVGYFSGMGDLDSGSGTAIVTSAGSGDIFLARYSANGSFLDGFGYGSTGADRARKVAANPINGDIFLSGTFNGSFDFDPSANAKNLTSATANASFFQKFETVSAPGIALVYPVANLAENQSTQLANRIANVTLMGRNRNTFLTRIEGPDAGYFQLTGSQLQLKPGVVLDYEVKPTYSISVVADDPSTPSTSDAFTTFVLVIQDTNEPPVDIFLSNTSIPENAPPNASLGSLSTVDPDANESFTYSLPSGILDNASFAVTGNTVNAKASFNFEVKSSYELMIRVSDARGLIFDKFFTINVANLPDSSVVERLVFYNRSTSSIFGNGAGNPVNSIDLTKVALRAGETANFDHYTNYTRGLNGLLVDFESFTGVPTAEDFRFETWNGIDSSGFVAVSVAPTLSLFPNQGINGADRIKIEFPDNAIRNTWLKTVVRGGLKTDLPRDDEFYFGNAVADFDVGNLSSSIRVNATDTGVVRQNQSPVINSVNVHNIYDLNKDGRVSATDVGLVRQNQAPLLMMLITAPFPPSPSEEGGIVDSASSLPEFSPTYAMPFQSLRDSSLLTKGQPITAFVQMAVVAYKPPELDRLKPIPQPNPLAELGGKPAKKEGFNLSSHDVFFVELANSPLPKDWSRPARG